MNRLFESKGHRIAFLLGGMSLGFPGASYACGVCVAAAVWRIYPPLLSWSMIVPGWFLVWLILKSLTRRNLSPMPSLLMGLFLLLLAGWFAGTSFGPFVVVPFALLLAWTWIRFSRRAPQETPRNFRLWVHGVGGAAVALMAFASLAEAVSPTPREPLDIIKKWPGTAESRMALNRLGAGGEASRPALREILRNTPATFSPLEASEAAEELKPIGDPLVDVPLLLDAYDRIFQPFDDTSADPLMIEWALASYTGIELPSGSTPGVWREAWVRSREGRSDDDTSTASLARH